MSSSLNLSDRRSGHSFAFEPHEASLRRVIRRLDHIGVVIDEETIRLWGALIRHWPTVERVSEHERRRRRARELYEQGLKVEAIAKDIGCSYTATVGLLEGIEKRTGRGHSVSEADREVAVAMVRAGHSHREAARRIGRSQSTVSRLLQDLEPLAA